MKRRSSSPFPVPLLKRRRSPIAGTHSVSRTNVNLAPKRRSPFVVPLALAAPVAACVCGLTCQNSTGVPSTMSDATSRNGISTRK